MISMSCKHTCGSNAAEDIRGHTTVDCSLLVMNWLRQVLMHSQMPSMPIKSSKSDDSVAEI